MFYCSFMSANKFELEFELQTEGEKVGPESRRCLNTRQYFTVRISGKSYSKIVVKISSRNLSV